MFTNLRFWSDSEEVLGATITLFHEMSASAQGSRLLASMPPCHTLLNHHGPEHFPFLAVSLERFFKWGPIRSNVYAHRYQ